MAQSPDQRRQRVLFSGDVQGVGFRYRTLHLSSRFAVRGFVRNLSDGRVELVCEGEGAELDRFVKAVRSDMEDYIQDVSVEFPPATGEFSSFEIRH